MPSELEVVRSHDRLERLKQKLPTALASDSTLQNIPPHLVITDYVKDSRPTKTEGITYKRWITTTMTDGRSVRMMRKLSGITTTTDSSGNNIIPHTLILSDVESPTTPHKKANLKTNLNHRLAFDEFFNSYVMRHMLDGRVPQVTMTLSDYNTATHPQYLSKATELKYAPAMLEAQGVIGRGLDLSKAQKQQIRQDLTLHALVRNFDTHAGNFFVNQEADITWIDIHDPNATRGSNPRKNASLLNLFAYTTEDTPYVGFKPSFEYTPRVGDFLAAASQLQIALQKNDIVTEALIIGDAKKAAHLKSSIDEMLLIAEFLENAKSQTPPLVNENTAMMDIAITLIDELRTKRGKKITSQKLLNHEALTTQFKQFLQHKRSDISNCTEYGNFYDDERATFTKALYDKNLHDLSQKLAEITTQKQKVIDSLNELTSLPKTVKTFGAISGYVITLDDNKYFVTIAKSNIWQQEMACNIFSINDSETECAIVSDYRKLTNSLLTYYSFHDSAEQDFNDSSLKTVGITTSPTTSPSHQFHQAKNGQHNSCNML